MKVLVVGEDPESLGHICLVRKSQPQGASILTRVPEVELPTL
jgi:hypothetical protein